MTLAIVVELDYEVNMLDVQTAFFNPDLEEDVFLNIMPGYESNHQTGGPLILKPRKSLYGLHQSLNDLFGSIDVELVNTPSPEGRAKSLEKML